MEPQHLHCNNIILDLRRVQESVFASASMSLTHARFSPQKVHCIILKFLSGAAGPTMEYKEHILCIAANGLVKLTLT